MKERRAPGGANLAGPFLPGTCDRAYAPARFLPAARRGECPERAESRRPAGCQASDFNDYLVASPGHDHINFAAAAFGTDQPPAAIEHGRFGAVPRSRLGRRRPKIELDAPK